MKNIILPTSYLPPIEYFHLLQKSDCAIIEQYETYKKQTYRNRCNIYTEKGVMSLSIPVNKPFGNHTKTKDIEISYVENWQKNHLKAIKSAYQASPFFLYYKDDIEEIYNTEFVKLLDFNNTLLNKIIELLNIKASIKYSSDFIETENLYEDFRFKISPKIKSALQTYPSYIQVFTNRHGFIKNLSIIDLLFNMGPESSSYLRQIK